MAKAKKTASKTAKSVKKEQSAWECECGSVEFSLNAPEECMKCFRIDSFSQIPVEIAKDRESKMMEGYDEN